MKDTNKALQLNTPLKKLVWSVSEGKVFLPYLIVAVLAGAASSQFLGGALGYAAAVFSLFVLILQDKRLRSKMYYAVYLENHKQLRSHRIRKRPLDLFKSLREREAPFVGMLFSDYATPKAFESWILTEIARQKIGTGDVKAPSFDELFKDGETGKLLPDLGAKVFGPKSSKWAVGLKTEAELLEEFERLGEGEVIESLFQEKQQAS